MKGRSRIRRARGLHGGVSRAGPRRSIDDARRHHRQEGGGARLPGLKGGKIKHVIYIQFDNVHACGTTRTCRRTSSRCRISRTSSRTTGRSPERPHDPDLPHGRRDPEHAHRALSRPARPGRVELVRLLPARRLGRLLVDVQVLDRLHGRRQPGEQPADAVGGPELQHGQRRPAVARRHRRRPQRAGAVGAVHARRLRRRQRRRRRTRCSRTTTRSSAYPARRRSRRSCAGHERQGRERRRSRPARRHPRERDGEPELATIASVGTAGHRHGSTSPHRCEGARSGGTSP